MPIAMSDSDLVERFGSPLYVYQTEDLDTAFAELSLALPPDSVIFYSLKANPHPVLAGRLATLGCFAEVSSLGELAIAVRSGFIPHDILYTGPGKSRSEILEAVSAGVRRFSAESVLECLKLSRVASEVGCDLSVLIRINAADGSGARATGLRMTGAPSQFGSDPSTVLSHIDAILRLPRLSLDGLHFFPVSGAKSELDLIAAFQSSVLTASDLVANGFPLKFLDLGGGFSSPFALPGVRPEYLRLREKLIEMLDSHLGGWRTGEPRIAFESGRFLVGTSGRLLTRIVDMKSSGGREYIILESGVNHLGGMSGLGRLARPAATPTPSSNRPTREAFLVGPLCTPADVLNPASPIGEQVVGELLCFENVGAYGLTASLVGFLSRPLPKEVFFDGLDVISVSRTELVRSYENPA